MANPRFDFEVPVPEVVYGDLLQCYAHFVSASEHEMRLTSDTERVLRLASAWMKGGRRGLLLCGNCGTGKTKLIEALEHLITYYSGGSGDKDTRILPMRIYSAKEIVRLSLSKDGLELERFNRLKKVRRLGIDDIGTEPVTVKNYGTDTNPIVDILFSRYETMKVTILSTNYDMETIRKTYGERIYDRLCEMYDRIVFNFKSFRQM